VATGRRPTTEGLNLDAAGVEREGSAVRVDSRLRTTGKGIWAAGDVTGGLQFTHVADYMARIVLQNALLPIRRKVDYSNVPWVTFTDPEVAHVGLSQQDADERGGRSYVYELSDLDRAIVDGRTQGFVKISADRKGRILGATILGSQAGEMLFPLVLAMQSGLRLSQIYNTIFPYPTMMEGIHRTIRQYQTERLNGVGGRVLKKVVSWMT
jgi:pyruvate/2-oxoglutarate dehydrogenase complex dihydrolipoamide dehydrogenase (E3) component